MVEDMRWCTLAVTLLLVTLLELAEERRAKSLMKSKCVNVLHCKYFTHMLTLKYD